jgi:hypothetical protein
MSDKVERWEWWASSDEEMYTIGPCVSREEVISEAIESELGFDYDAEVPACKFHIVEAMKWDIQLADYFEVGEWFERLEEGDFSDLGEPEGYDGLLSHIKDDVATDLEAAVRAAVAEWQKRHAIKITPWKFGKTRNGEWIKHTFEAETQAQP